MQNVKTLQFDPKPNPEVVPIYGKTPPHYPVDRGDLSYRLLMVVSLLLFTVLPLIANAV